MKKSKFFIFLLITAFCLAFFTSVLADQEGNFRWCNSDQYGCWVTGDNNEQSYIMFWSESARDFFMGPGSSAGVVTQYPAGKMPLDPAPAEKDLLHQLLDQFTDMIFSSKLVKPEDRTPETKAQIYKILEDYLEQFVQTGEFGNLTKEEILQCAIEYFEKEDR